ncbi:LexA family transcriptional regulator [Spirosoma sp. KNUC1025]|uniref:LexA family protein n=1 Tax=Spirosoma sp. KNUC1025 TaxID=2894082 RepID=UPI0038698C0B|nr:DNA repair protein [Spirosoma sp. KNUC1025]UFH54677.1 DNA repair protein [Spirosoma sp. KNUC1025]
MDKIPPENIFRVSYTNRKGRAKTIPLFLSYVQAGFASPAENYIERRLNLHDLCVQYPDATYFVRVAGDSMIGAHILPGSILVVDAVRPIKSGSIIVAWLNGECCVKYFVRTGRMITLHPANPNYTPTFVHLDRDNLRVMGTVTYIVSKPEPYVQLD